MTASTDQSTRGAPAAETRRAPDTITIGRLATMLVLLVLANLWFSHHLGFGLEGPAQITAAVAVFAGAAKALDGLLGTSVDATFKTPMRALLRRALSWPVLVVVCIFALPTVLTLSTVEVVPESPNDSVNASLERITAKSGAAKVRSREGIGLQRFHPWTDPLGRDFLLSADGYIPTVITVRSPMATRVHLGDDVSPLPTLLFRPPLRGSEVFVNGGRFIVVDSTGRDTLAEMRGNPTASGVEQYRSFLVGRRQEVQSSPDWQFEARIDGSSPQIEALTMLGWKNPFHLVPEHPLTPGMLVRGEILTGRNKREAFAEVAVGRTRFQDVLMLEVVEEGQP